MNIYDIIKGLQTPWFGHRLLDAAQVCDCARVCTVNGMRLHMQWCSFILGFLSERECKHRPLAKPHRPLRCQRCSLGLILVALGHSNGPDQERGRKMVVMVKDEWRCKDPLKTSTANLCF